MKPTRLLALAAVLAVTACGTTEAPVTNDEAPKVGGPVSVVDSRGTEVKLDAPATKVIGLEWGDIEMLVSLGVMPIGAADPKGYATWVTAAPLDASVKDVGMRGEPSVDAIVNLDPDLIVMEAEKGSPIVAQLEKYVPVIVTTGSDAKDNVKRMRDDLTMIATAVGKTTEATALLGELDAALAAGKEKIAQAGAAGAGYAMADGWKEGSSINVRMFGKGALVSELAVRLGLTNAWTGPVDEAWGLGQTDVEGLTVLKDPNIRFFYNASDGVDVFADGLAGNPIWESLPFVAAKRVYKLPPGIWTFGGPKSCQQYVDALVKAYTA